MYLHTKNSSENQTSFFLFAGKSWVRKMIPKLPVMVWNEIQSELWEESQIHSKNRDRTKLWFFQIFADSLDRHKVIIFSILNGQVVVSCQPLDCESCLFFYKSAKCEDQEEIFFKKSTYRETFKWGNYWFLPFL